VRRERERERERERRTHELLSVRLMNAILHGLVDELRIRRRLSESGGKNSESLEVEDLIARK